MAGTESAGPTIAASLRRHVLGPVETAESLIECERAEVEAEREAFERFRDRIAGIETASITSQHGRTTLTEQPQQQQERVRTAYRETVMSVSHYDETYGEPLVEHFAAELSADLAAGLREHPGVTYTPLYKQTLVAAVGTAIESRSEFGEVLNAEAASLATHRQELLDILANFDGAAVPAWHRPEFDAQLENLTETRQDTLQSRTPPALTDGHELSTYLYQEQEWTYPVLTAVARFRRSTEW